MEKRYIPREMVIPKREIVKHGDRYIINLPKDLKRLKSLLNIMGERVVTPE